jgi:glutathione S-transferase
VKLLGEGPSPWKTVMVLEELNLPYETVFLEFGKLPGGVESDEFLKRNPAGRVPLLYDPKTGKIISSLELLGLLLIVPLGILLSESNAIAKYLVDQFDKDNRLIINIFPGKYFVDQWLNFQGATQGPIFQQASSQTNIPEELRLY